MLTRTSDDGMSTVEVTDDELRDMAALDVSAAVDVVTAHARARIDMSNRHAPLTAARDLLALAPAMAAELRAARVGLADMRETASAPLAALDAARAEIERLRTAAADERADVVAAGQDVVTRLHARNDDKESHAAYTLGAFLSLVVEGKHEGAHVGAAKGGERG